MGWFIDLIELEDLLEDGAPDEREPVPLSIEAPSPETEEDETNDEKPEPSRVIIIDI